MDTPPDPAALVPLLLRQLYELRASHDALLQVIAESMPPREASAFVKKVDERKRELFERAAISLEDASPTLAARLSSPDPAPPGPQP